MMGSMFDLGAIARENLGTNKVGSDARSVKSFPHKTYTEWILNGDQISPGCFSNRVMVDVAFTRFIDWMGARGSVELHGSGDRRPMRFWNWMLVFFDAEGAQVLAAQDGPDRYKREVQYLYDLARSMVYEKNDIFSQSRCGACPDCVGLNPGDIMGTFPTDVTGHDAADPGMALMEMKLPEAGEEEARSPSIDEEV